MQLEAPTSAGVLPASEFAEAAALHRAELRAHCLGMLGSVEDAEDALQETFLRAWRRRRTYQGRSSVKNWLYSIATNACFDALDRRRRSPQLARGADYEVLESIPGADQVPDAEVLAKETVELAFMAAIRHLPPRQRAALILTGVLGLSAKDTAKRLNASVQSVNSALQRARRAMRKHLPEQRLMWALETDPNPDESALLEGYVDAIERGDTDAFVEMLCADVRWR